jgi:hypothetical protein
VALSSTNNGMGAFFPYFEENSSFFRFAVGIFYRRRGYVVLIPLHLLDLHALLSARVRRKVGQAVREGKEREQAPSVVSWRHVVWSYRRCSSVNRLRIFEQYVSTYVLDSGSSSLC